MAYGFHYSRKHPDRMRHTSKSKQKDKGTIGGNGNAVLNGWVSLIQDHEGLTGEVSIIADPASQGKYIGNGRSFLFYKSKPLNWVIPVEIRTHLDTGMVIKYGKKRMLPLADQVTVWAPYVLESKKQHLPDLSPQEKTVLDKILQGVNGRLFNLVLRKVNKKEDNIESRFTPDLQELMQQGYFYGQVEIRL
ncbi:hypothetical protein KY338_01620 [Candidatus Woesearchaeota archaeon]|nr:hypothetical protein [Candidatus Woesearchaeota archaeon]MBW3005612.1 hypothetical protein [Candidatus Woesearchaeota archaeon]